MTSEPSLRRLAAVFHVFIPIHDLARRVFTLRATVLFYFTLVYQHMRFKPCWRLTVFQAVDTNPNLL